MPGDVSELRGGEKECCAVHTLQDYETAERNRMPQTLITKYTSSVAKDLVTRANDLSGLGQGLEVFHGELKEMFVARLLKAFLPSQLSVGSGTVINVPGKRCRQTDVIVYDNRLLPPFIQEQHLGVYPVESVIGTIEIKTTVTSDELKRTRTAIEALDDVVDQEARFLDKTFPQLLKCHKLESFGRLFDLPLSAVFGFGVKRITWPLDQRRGELQLKKFPQNFCFMCIPGEFCWAKVQDEWKLGRARRDPASAEPDYAEVARFVALFVDNARRIAETRFRYLLCIHDWLSLYIRERN